MADIHRDEGRREGTLTERKRTLLELLRLRWAPLPPEVVQVIQSTQDAGQLAEWLRSFATARDLDSIGIVSSR
jgi:hypothetical protein